MGPHLRHHDIKTVLTLKASAVRAPGLNASARPKRRLDPDMTLAT